MTYTIRVTVEVAADDQAEAADAIRHALDGAKKAEIVLLSLEDIATREDD